ncbi:CHAT domain-containing protein [Synechococcus sp. EJ6-Ellesmere]|uniref:CHAT domain-containing protein n=1 Tax=Synechococcus sp. EJ6-Ellesmere TaxID=2823734 RepID=UPI0020CFD338|nr:CHAT domain-containing protein [Synechococcus sp. EJ6-Ellesmere]MCP9826284.1 hypothetical protein [Synechococcus sp. EJ6-Ellesmere]
MNGIDLQLQSNGSRDQLLAFLVSPAGQEAFPVTVPPQLLELQNAWVRRFLAHHDPASPAIPSDVVRDWGLRLTAAMAHWLAQPAWHQLQVALEQQPRLPLRIRCQGDTAVIERLPWEALPLDRPIWRQGQSAAPSPGRPMRAHRPRVLLLVGLEDGLDLTTEINQLSALKAQGRIELEVLRGPGSSLGDLRHALLSRSGWDALVFLGHSEPDAEGGGRLQLGDGGWLAASALGQELQVAASHGLQLVLLSSCSGIDLARSCNAAGIPWALCFRELVPTQAAAMAFCELLAAMERGSGLHGALTHVRRHLEHDGPAGSHLLLSAYGNGQTDDIHLPLRKRRQLLRRLATSQRSQAIAAGLALLLAAVGEIEPSNPVSSFLLDRRLYMQRLWRGVIQQPGPSGLPLPVLLLEQSRADGALAVQATPGRVSRAALARVLELSPPVQVPKLGLDVVLDEPAPHTAELAAVIRQQARPLVFAGYLGPSANLAGAGLRSRPVAELEQAGLQARDLAVGTVAGSGPLKAVPLQLRHAISAENFAGALSSAVAPLLPAESVIDWSIDWTPLIHRVEAQDLPALRSPALLVGSDGRIDRDQADLFAAPGAVRDALPRWGGSSGEVPGALVQAVLAQSLSMGHWLRPWSLAACTALAAGLGVLIAAAQANRGRRLVLVGSIILVAVPLALHVAVFELQLLPLLLPLAALGSTALVRRG